VLQARPSTSTSDGLQQSFVGGYPVVLQSMVATDAPLTVNTSTMNWPGLVQSQGSTAPVCQVNPSVPGLTVPLSTLSLSSVSQGMVPATLVVPPAGYVAPTVAMSGQTSMLGVNSTVSNVASVSNVANVITSLPVGDGVSSSSSVLSLPAYQPLVVVNTPQLVRPYNGSTNWKSFRDHFTRVAKVNKWEDDNTKAQHLMLAIEGNAAEVLKDISDSCPTVVQDI